MPSYKIVCSECSDNCYTNEQLYKSLEDKVEILIAEGWHCIGGVAVIGEGGNVCKIYQTMIKMPN